MTESSDNKRSQSAAMAAKFDLKFRQKFDGSAQLFKPSNRPNDLKTVVRKTKSMSDIRHSLQIGKVNTPNTYVT